MQSDLDKIKLEVEKKGEELEKMKTENEEISKAKKKEEDSEFWTLVR